jgi:hydroxypyruvate isomerase
MEEIQAVEITWIKDKQQKKMVRDLLQSWGGIVVYSGAPALALSGKSLCSSDKNLRHDSVMAAKKVIDDACYFDASSVLLISGTDPGLGKRQESKAFLIESLMELIHHAKSVDGGLRVTLEPADRDIHRKQLIGPISEAVEIAKTVRKHTPNFELTIDMSHLAQLGENKRKALHIARGFFQHVHLANAIVKNVNHSRFGDEHPRFGIEEGEHGRESIIEFLTILNQTNFFLQKSSVLKPIISIEVKPEDGEAPLPLLIRSIELFLEACLKV